MSIILSERGVYVRQGATSALASVEKIRRMINILDDKIEFVSLSGLLSGLSKEDILRGVSQTQNKNLANVFYRLKHIEAYGTGIQRIFDLYADNNIQTDIITDNTFTMVLPNRNSEVEAPQEITATVSLTRQEKLIVDYIEENGSITDEEIQSMFDIKQTRVYVIIRTMKEKGILVTKGRGNNKKHYLK